MSIADIAQVLIHDPPYVCDSGDFLSTVVISLALDNLAVSLLYVVCFPRLGNFGMSSPAWVITGFKIETFDSRATRNKAVSTVKMIGRSTETTQIIMHGGTKFLDKGKPLGYAYVHGYFENMQDYDKLPLAERGLGAVSGGCILRANAPCTRKYTHEQEWGAISEPETSIVCTFYDSTLKTYKDIVACFDNTNVAPISGDWLTGQPVTGPSTHSDRTDWMVSFTSNPNAGNPPFHLEKGELWLVVYLS